MAEEIRGGGLPEDPVVRLLEQAARYGLDQETTLIYISSVNLMSIIGLIERRYGGKSNFSLPVPTALPALSPAASGAAPGAGPTADLVGMLMKMLGGQGGGTTPSGQGINPAALLNLLSVLGQNVDLGSLMTMLAGMMGTGAKPAPGPGGGRAVQPATSGAGQAPAGAKDGASGQKTAVEEKPVKREIPKIMKWDQLDDRKKA